MAAIPTPKDERTLLDKIAAYTPIFLSLRSDMGLGDHVGFGRLSSTGHRGSGAVLSSIKAGDVGTGSELSYVRIDGSFIPVDPSRGDILLVRPDTEHEYPCAVSLDDAGIDFLDLPSDMVRAAMGHELGHLKYELAPETYGHVMRAVSQAVHFGAPFRHPELAQECVADVIGASYTGYQSMKRVIDYSFKAIPLAYPDPKRAKRMYGLLQHRFSALERLEKRGFDARD